MASGKKSQGNKKGFFGNDDKAEELGLYKTQNKKKERGRKGREKKKVCKYLYMK